MKATLIILGGFLCALSIITLLYKFRSPLTSVEDPIYSLLNLDPRHHALRSQARQHFAQKAVVPMQHHPIERLGTPTSLGALYHFIPIVATVFLVVWLASLLLTANRASVVQFPFGLTVTKQPTYSFGSFFFDLFSFSITGLIIVLVLNYFGIVKHPRIDLFIDSMKGFAQATMSSFVEFLERFLRFVLPGNAMQVVQSYIDAAKRYLHPRSSIWYFLSNK